MVAREKASKSLKGFTLVELMVTLVIAFIITGAAYSAYVVQQKNYAVQEQVAEIQQNIRIGLEIMTREMRMSGYDPTFTDKYGIITAKEDQFSFTADLCEDGGIPAATAKAASCKRTETFTYELYDRSGDGTEDMLRRTSGGSAVIENIEHLEFRYILRDGSRIKSPTPLQLDQIVAVEVSILARASKEDHDYQDIKTYTTAGGLTLGPYDDKYRRRMLITTIQLRNMAYRS